ncbi:TapY2 family type IVa secretion system protein [Thalassotalea ponticola]|uniref:TapY2 family type IVa secretion system protein n=1 Tax=Thalassotalea ponticola TaxID=1523392 RepID=UPI0025B5DB62|nr:TapY2 family type IVa secretion system protein [Thalassotalea ponticola]MDN3653966.1 TapY2 family type IVa secretion system protein [Thalassotalea ponticola]
MKITLLSMSLLSLFTASGALAKQVNTAPQYSASNPRVEMKCHVVLADNSERLYFAALPKKEVKSLPSRLQNKGVPTKRAYERTHVQDVVECVPLEEPFSARLSRELDAKTGR